MQKVLNQAEIDAMVRAARGSSNTSTLEPIVAPWDIRAAGQIGREQMNAINLLHESFARNLTHSIGAYLRIVFEAGLVSAEHLTYREFLQRMPESTYIASFRALPLNVTALLQMDFSIAFPVIDLLLGGQASGDPPQRDLTEIEEQILESIVRIVLRELQSTWQALAIELSFEQRQPASQAHRLMPPEEKNLCLSFEIKMSNTRGTLNLAMPAVVSNALLRKISADCTYQRPRSLPESKERVKRVLLGATFPLELVVPDLHVTLDQLADLAPGSTVFFPRRADGEALVCVEGHPAFHAKVVKLGEHRAMRIQSHISKEGDL